MSANKRYWKSGERALFSALYQQSIIVIEETLHKHHSVDFFDDWLFMTHYNGRF